MSKSQKQWDIKSFDFCDKDVVIYSPEMIKVDFDDVNHNTAIELIVQISYLPSLLEYMDKSKDPSLIKLKDEMLSEINSIKNELNKEGIL